MDKGLLQVRLYRRAFRLLDDGLRTLAGLVHGIWLGLMSEEFIDAFDASFYGTQTEYVDTEYNRSGLLPWEVSAIEQWFSDCRRVAVTGAGGGREVLALLEMGFDAVGYEPNPQLQEFGATLLATAGYPDRLLAAPRSGWADGDGCFDGVVVGWASYMLIPGRRRRIDFLRQTTRRVAPGAPVLLSFYTRTDATPYFRVVARIGNVIRRLRRADPLHVGDGLVPFYSHSFTKADLEDELREAGLTPVHYEAVPYGHAVALVDGG